jgi:Family of unknown function (DUF5819)
MSASGSGPAPAPTRWWSRALVAATAVAVGAVVAVHLAATFFYNAPPNPVSQRYAKQVDAWIDPLFQQNWRLFAPNPISENIAVQARASLTPDGRLTGWYDLSALDQQAEAGNPAPGHVLQNGLRNAWFGWTGSHDANGNPTASDAATLQAYLLNVVLDRLRPLAGGTIGSIQIRAVTTLLSGPGRTIAQTAPQVRTLDWWTVPAHGAASNNAASNNTASNNTAPNNSASNNTAS